MSRPTRLSRPKVRLRIHEHTFVDHLTLAKVDGAFRIVAKTWHEV